MSALRLAGFLGSRCFVAFVSAAITSSARMDAWARSAISTLAGEGCSRSYICKKVAKKDGTHPHIRAADAVLAKVRANPTWRGEDSQAGGRPRVLRNSKRKQLVALVVKMRGRAVVTSAFCKRHLKFLRSVCGQTTRNEF